MILSASVLLFCLLAGAADASAIKGRHEQAPELDTKRLGLASPVELRRTQQKLDSLSQLEQREQLSKTTSNEHEQRREEKLEDLAQQREETLAQVKEPQAALRVPLRPYEARPQIRDELAKGQPAKPLLSHQSKTHQEERREELLVQLSNEKHEELSQQREEQVQKTHEEAKKTPLQPTRLDALPKGGQREEAELRGESKGQKFEESQWVQLPQEQLKLEQQELLPQQREESLKSTETKRTEQVDLKADYDQQRRLEADQLPIQQVQQIRYEEPLVQQQVVQQEEQRTFAGGIKGAGAAAFAEAEPYAFDYSVEGSSRRETGDVHGVVRGQYTVLNGDGSRRIVDYIADRDGFRAQVNTGELGTESQQPANVLLRSSQPPAQDITLQLEGKTREFLTAVPQAPLAAPLTKTVALPDNWNSLNGGGGGGGKTSWEPQQAQRKGGLDWETKGVQEPQESFKDERAPVLITHQPVKSTVQRVEEAPPKQGALKQEEPLKQEPLKQEREPLKQEPLKQELAQELPAKKAEQTRTPKAIAELRSSAVVQARANFESATAHRPIVHSYPVAPVVAHRQQHLQPPVVHRHHHYQHLAPAPHHARVHVSPPVRTYQLAHGAVPSRSQLQRDRYPPQPLNPRVSFYGANNFDDDLPSSSSSSAAGFEHPINSS